MSRYLPPIVCREPAHDEWFRVKPGEERRCVTPMVRDLANGEMYLVAGGLWPLLGLDAELRCPRLCTNYRGDVFVWLVPSPASYDGQDLFPSPAVVLAELAELKWIRAAYDVASSKWLVSINGPYEGLPPPPWPKMHFIDLFEKAIQGRVIATPDHPLLRQGGAA